MSEAIITRFDSENPCWTAELLELAGEDTEDLPELVRNGTLRLFNGIYSLTEAGISEFDRIASEMFLEGNPGTPPTDMKRSVARTKLRLLLDNAHIQRWGIKDFRTNISLPIRPNLTRDEIFSIEDRRLKWLYTESPIWKKIEAEFPAVSIESRRTDLVPPEKLAEWCKENCPKAGSLAVDLLYLCRYDFMQYRDFPGHPNDPMRLINTDRFLFVFSSREPADNLETIGKFHIWLNNLRRMIIPGYVDRDTQEQDSVSWLIFAAETENEAGTLAEELSSYGEDLVKNANPCEIWTISLEALEKLNEKRELVWELLPETAHQVQRTLLS
ncbi:MAG: hypothetical protein LLF78_06705 [Synergistaceae bacterium]|nr:hypothetical protein [Synergistaceae bacterium]